MSNLLQKIFGGGAAQLVSSIGGVVDNLVTTDGERQQLKAQIGALVNNHLAKIMELQTEVLKTEMTGNWLQRSWRPILMLTFGALLIMRWMGWTSNIPTEVELELMDIIKIGIGGYVVGRSAEKISKNLDIGALKKKDRKDVFEE